MATRGETFEEVLRLVLETQGQEGLDRLRDALSQVGDVSDKTRAQTTSLIDNLQALDKQAGAAAEFDKLTAAIGESEQRLADLQSQAYQMSLALGAAEKPSRDLQRAQAEAKAEIERTEKSIAKQYETLSKLDDQLTAAGVDTRNMASLQATLAAQAERAAKSLQSQLVALRAEAKERGVLEQRLADEDAAFRRQAESSRAAADSLNAFKQRAREAREGTEQLTEAAQATSNVLGRLKAIAATALGFLSFRTVYEGIRGIVTEGSDAEQELGQLEATLASTGRQAEFTAEQLQAMADSMDKGLFSGGDITNAQTRLLSYTNIVGKEFPAALQVAIDQAQRLGISTEASAEIVGRALQTPTKAMDALSKQGFVLEDSQKQLLKQLEATGRTAEAQRIILDLLVESYGGAAAQASVNKMAGLWNRVREGWKDWQTEVANRGVLDYFKQQLDQLLATTSRLAADGTLGRWAQATADAIVGLAQAVRSTTAWLVEHAGAIALLAKAYAAFKIGAAIMQMNRWRLEIIAAVQAQRLQIAAMDAQGKGALRLGNILKRVPGSLVIAVTLVGLDLAIKGADKLAETLAKQSQAAKDAAAAQEASSKRMLALAAGYSSAAAALGQYAHQQVLAAEQVANLTEVEREGYRQRVAGLQQYLLKLNMYYVAMQEAGALTQPMADDWAKVRTALAGARQGLADIAAGAELAARAMTAKVPAAAQLVIDKLEGIGGDARLAADEIAELFAKLNFADSNALGNVALALSKVSEESAGAAKNVGDGLLRALQQLTGDELAKFQAASAAAFEQYKVGPAEAAAVLENTLYAALEKLGFSADRMGTRFTVAGRDAVAAFGAIVENANATSQQVEAAFNAALGRVSTLDDAKALGQVLRAAGEAGKIGFDQAERSAAALEARIRGITAAMDPLSDAFGQLGIQSQASLNAARDAAKAAFDAIRQGAASGKASVEDVRRALEAYGRAARDAVADSDSTAKVRVDNELAVLDAIYKVNDNLDDMGRHGRAAGKGIREGAEEASSALDQAAAAADHAASASGEAAEMNINAAGAMAEAGASASALSFSLGEVSQAWMEAFDTIGKNAVAGSPVIQWFADITNELTRQREQVRGLIAEQQQLLASYDEDASRREQLKQQFKFVGDGEIEQLLQAEKQVKAAEEARIQRKRQEAEAQRQADLKRIDAAKELAKAEGDARVAAGAGASGGEETIVIDWRTPSRATAASATAAEAEQADRIADLVAPRVLRKLQQSRAISNVRIKPR